MISSPVWSSKLADDDNYHCELLDEDNDVNEENAADRKVENTLNIFIIQNTLISFLNEIFIT